MRSGVAAIALALILSSCSAPFESALPPANSTPAESETPTDPPTEPSPTTSDAPSASSTTISSSAAPNSLPLAGTTGASLPEGTTAADLPEDPADRLGIMSDWLEDTYPDRTSGHAYSFFGEVFDLTFNVNITEEAEARALCPFFEELTSLYLFDTEHAVNLNGWILSDSGYFEEADWERFAC